MLYSRAHEHRRGKRTTLPVPAVEAVKARGYWESIWLRLRRDKLAIAGGIFIIVMFVVAFIGAPIADPHPRARAERPVHRWRRPEHVPARRSDDVGSSA